MLEVEIPYKPRPLQREMHRGLDAHRFGAVVAHRRFGKSVCSVNQLIKGALTCTRERPRFGYLAPTFRMAKQIVWDYAMYYSAGIPGAKPNQSELRIDYPNGSRLQLFGADAPDSLRGVYFDGVVLDEFGLMPPKTFSEVIRPTLSDRLGWALFVGTPAGKNQFYDVCQNAKNDPDWFFAEYKASETGIIDERELASARRDMTEDEYLQEYECSFDAAIKGAIYAKELAIAREEGRVSVVPVDPILSVDTTWDIGMKDAMAIWFTQSARGGELRVVDYYEASGEGLPHYIGVLRQKGYLYGEHWAPHDILVRELSSGRSRFEVAESLGLKFSITPNIALHDGIHAARMLMPLCWFDAKRCEAGLEALKHYRWDYNSRLNEFKATPLHDWSSHGADAFRYVAVRYERPNSRRRTDAMSVPAPTHNPLGWLA